MLHIDNFSDVKRLVKKGIEAFTSLIMWAGSQNDRWWVPWAKFAPSGIKRSNSKWVPTRRGESATIITRHKMSDCRKVKLSFRELITRVVSEHEIPKVESSCRLQFLLLWIDLCSDFFRKKSNIAVKNVGFSEKTCILRFYILGNFPFLVIKVPPRSSENLVLGFP